MSQVTAPNNNTADVRLCRDFEPQILEDLFSRYSLQVVWVEAGAPIPGTHFGEPEAGLIGHSLFLRGDTPIHSALHESCHFICMDQGRRENLHTDAGGDYDEENGVCFLSILLADHIQDYNQAMMMQDMDSWGYTFRLGSARQWFEEDADDPRRWLIEQSIVTPQLQPTWRLR